MRKRLIVTGTAAAFVLTAGIVGAVAVQPPGQEQDRDTSAGPAVPDALQGLPPMMLKREPVPTENGTVDVHAKPEPQKNPFTYTPAPKPSYTPRHMADPQVDQPSGNFTMAPLPGIDFGQGSGPSSPSKPSVQPTRPPSQGPTPTPSPDPTPTPTPTPTPEPTDPPSEEPTDPPSEEPTNPPSEEPTAPPTEEPTPEPTEEPTPEPTEEPTPEPSEPSAEPTTEPSPEPSPSN